MHVGQVGKGDDEERRIQDMMRVLGAAIRQADRFQYDRRFHADLLRRLREIGELIEQRRIRF